jgi:DNA-binding SARP family transcriptional activator
MRVQIELLGAFRVVVDGRVVAANAWRRERSAALVKLLSLSTGHRLHREQAMEALWPEMAAEASAANLRKAVHFARRALGKHELIGAEHDVLVLAPSQELVIDAAVFEAAAHAALRAPSPDPAACAQAAERYGGELLPDDRYVAWAEEPRERLRRLYARLLKAGHLWERLLALEPTDEDAQRAVMQAALDAGNRGEVVRRFQQLRERLRVDLGVGPAAATVAIYSRAIEADTPPPIDITDRVRGSLAWGLIHLQSGEFAKAERVAKEARRLAIEGVLAREVGEASALYGLAAHMQGRWPDLFRSEFIEWIRSAPTFAPTVFDGHLCLAEFCLCGANGHEDLARATRELLAIATDARSTAGRAIATLILGEAELFSGDLEAAEASLDAAERMYEEIAECAGRVIALQRRAEVALARGQKYRAGRIVQKGFRLAESNWLSPHLLLRLQALAVETAGTTARTAEAIQRGDRWLAQGGMCQPCSMGFRVAAAIALAEAGEVEQTSRRLDEAERLAGMWNGGPWVAAEWEGRGVQRRAQGQTQQAAALFREAASRYAALGRRRDQERCLARAGAG